MGCLQFHLFMRTACCRREEFLPMMRAFWPSRCPRPQPGGHNRHRSGLRTFEDDEHGELLVADEAVLGAGRHVHRLPLPHIDALPLDLERAVPSSTT